ncbi:hypothetical protein GCM10023081_38160 [Arthrobacter ginkgonis]|uniref:Uncharacterized protein n=1 Tax=Arthrobacter ginkgonis TaxID=1630594 RepID=A0ABP7CWW5_9MICC
MPSPVRLTAWTANPSTSTNPLPSPSTARRSGGWPIGLLSELLAPEIARRGVTYKRGQGFRQFGETLDDYAVATIARTVLTIAAEHLDPHQSRYESLERVRDMAAEWMDEAHAEAHSMIDDYEEAEAVAQAATAAPTSFYAAAVEGMEARDALALDRETAARVAPFDEYAVALSRTARDLKQSGHARAALARDLRSLLPAPVAEADTSGDDAAAWLSQFDEVDKVRQADLAREYDLDGAPGGLSGSELRALAATRWGMPRALRGYPTFRPARAADRTARETVGAAN